MTQSSLDASVGTARALGHPARLRTVAMLRHGELCLCQITAVLRLAPSTVSAHVRELRQAGLVLERKEGRWVYFGLTDEPGLRTWVDLALGWTSADAQIVDDARMVAELGRLPVEDLCRMGYEAARAKHASRRSPRAAPADRHSASGSRHER